MAQYWALLCVLNWVVAFYFVVKTSFRWLSLVVQALGIEASAGMKVDSSPGSDTALCCDLTLTLQPPVPTALWCELTSASSSHYPVV